MKLFSRKSKIITPDDRADLHLSIAALIYFLTQAINLTIKTALPVPMNLWGVISAFFGMVILFFYMRAWKFVMRRNKYLVTKSYLFFILVFVLSAMIITLHAEPLTVLMNPYLMDVFVFWLPTGLCAASVKNKKIMYEVFMKASYVFVILGVLCFLGGKMSEADENANTYNMQLGFTLIIPTLFFLNEVFKGKYKHIVLFLLQIAIIVTYANRGVLLSVIFFVFYKVMVDRKNYVFSFIAFVAGVLLIVFMEPIALFLLDFLGNYGLSSRTLVLMLDNNIQQSSGRDEIWAICGKMMYEYPITGYGLGGECYQIYRHMTFSGAFGYGYSPHNGILQFLLQFGWLGGAVATVIFLLPIFRMNMIKDVNRNNIILIFCSAIVIPCCYSAGDVFLKPAVAIYLFLYYFNIKAVSPKNN